MELTADVAARLNTGHPEIIAVPFQLGSEARTQTRRAALTRLSASLFTEIRLFIVSVRLQLP